MDKVGRSALVQRRVWVPLREEVEELIVGSVVQQHVVPPLRQPAGGECATIRPVDLIRVYEIVGLGPEIDFAFRQLLELGRNIIPHIPLHGARDEPNLLTANAPRNVVSGLP